MKGLREPGWLSTMRERHAASVRLDGTSTQHQRHYNTAGVWSVCVYPNGPVQTAGWLGGGVISMLRTRLALDNCLSVKLQQMSRYPFFNRRIDSSYVPAYVIDFLVSGEITPDASFRMRSPKENL